MGVEIDPPQPDVLIMTIGGVQLDPTKAPPLWPYPGNKIYYLDLFGFNRWRGFTGSYRADVFRDIGGWQFIGQSVHPLSARVFLLRTLVNGPLGAGTNELDFSAGYEFGFFSVSEPAEVPADPTSSFTSMAEAMNIDISKRLKVDPFVVDADETVYRYVDKRDGTNLKILLDRTFVP